MNSAPQHERFLVDPTKVRVSWRSLDGARLVLTITERGTGASVQAEGPIGSERQLVSAALLRGVARGFQGTNLDQERAYDHPWYIPAKTCVNR